jgi:hypothetical protein
MVKERVEQNYSKRTPTVQRTLLRDFLSREETESYRESFRNTLHKATLLLERMLDSYCRHIHIHSTVSAYL